MSKLIDLTGQKFGSRTVLRKVPMPGRQAHWLVRCDCGKEDVVPSQRLRKGGGNACRKCGRATFTKLIDLTGQRFGKWQVLNRANQNPSALWNVVCDCGRDGRVSGYDLRTGHSKSCKSCGSTKHWHALDLRDRDWCWLLGVFHGDGSTYFAEDGGGTVTFACTPPENQAKISETLDRLGVPWGKTGNGVNVYSVRLAEGFARFKVSGLGREQWMFPENPTHWEEWIAGLLDSDGCVSRDGRSISFSQKAHGGLDFLRVGLGHLEIASTTYDRPSRGRAKPQECVQILAGSRDAFKTLVRPRYPKKSFRLAQTTPPRLRNLTGLRFGRRVVLHHVSGSIPTQWMTRCDCGFLFPVAAQKLLTGKSHACRSCTDQRKRAA